MEQGKWLLVCTCHDGFESEYLDDGIKEVAIPLKETYLQNAMMESLDIWNSMKAGEINPVKKEKLKKDCTPDWGHFDPYLVSKSNPNRREKLT